MVSGDLCDDRYKTSVEEDAATIDDPKATPRQKVAARLLRIEKTILGGTPDPPSLSVTTLGDFWRL